MRPPGPRDFHQATEYEGSACLYRDHLGRRVVLDVEGEGVLQAAANRGGLQVIADGVDAAPPCEFQGYATVTCAADGPVSAAAWSGPDLTGAAGVRATEVRGCGWIVSCHGPTSVDGRPPVDLAASPGSPVPVLRGAASDAGMVFIACPEIVCREVDGFAVDDATALPAHGWQVKNASELVELHSARHPSEQPFTAPLLSHLNGSEFIVTVPAGNLGVILRRTYDRFHGRQRARVVVDGVPHGYWYEAAEDRQVRWGVSDFGLIPGLTAGRSELHVLLDPPSGTPLWTISRLTVFALLPSGSQADNP